MHIFSFNYGKCPITQVTHSETSNEFQKAVSLFCVLWLFLLLGSQTEGPVQLETESSALCRVPLLALSITCIDLLILIQPLYSER